VQDWIAIELLVADFDFNGGIHVKLPEPGIRAADAGPIDA